NVQCVCSHVFHNSLCFSIPWRLRMQGFHMCCQIFIVHRCNISLQHLKQFLVLRYACFCFFHFLVYGFFCCFFRICLFFLFSFFRSCIISAGCKKDTKE